MASRKTFKFRLYPTPKQEQTFLFYLRRCRELYNSGLEERQAAYHMRRTSLTCYTQINELPDLKQAFPAYQDVPSHVLQDVLRRLDKAFAAFFRRVKNGESPGYPRFVRHEAAFTTVVPGSPGHNPLFCQWFPTGTCVSGNAGVRSFRDKSILASAVREV